MLCSLRLLATWLIVSNSRFPGDELTGDKKNAEHACK